MSWDARGPMECVHRQVLLDTDEHFTYFAAPLVPSQSWLPSSTCPTSSGHSPAGNDGRVECLAVDESHCSLGAEMPSMLDNHAMLCSDHNESEHTRTV